VKQLGKTISEFEVESALDSLCAIFNFDFAKEKPPLRPERLSALFLYLEKARLNNQKGFARAAAMVADVKSFFDPIVEAHTADEPAVELEQRLADEVNRHVASWRLERKIEKGRLGDRWEIVLGYNTNTLREFIVALGGALLRHNAIERLRRCKNCRRYIRHTAGRHPEFCPGLQCRNEFNNRNNRMRDRVKQLARLARTPEYDLTDGNKRKIRQWIGDAEFKARREELAKIRPPITDKDAQRFIDGSPEPLRAKLAEARRVEKEQAEK